MHHSKKAKFAFLTVFYSSNLVSEIQQTLVSVGLPAKCPKKERKADNYNYSRTPPVGTLLVLRRVSENRPAVHTGLGSLRNIPTASGTFIHSFTPNKISILQML